MLLYDITQGNLEARYKKAFRTASIYYIVLSHFDGMVPMWEEICEKKGLKGISI
jgi:hypothetical protein